MGRWMDKCMFSGYNAFVCSGKFCVGTGETTQSSTSLFFFFLEFQLSGEARRRESWLLGNERGSRTGPCDRWRGWLGEAGCWWSGQLCLTVACCFSALSFASSSCFCKAAWRDFISSLSSEREARNKTLACPPYTLRAPLPPARPMDGSLKYITVESHFAQKVIFWKYFSLFNLRIKTATDMLRWVNQVHTVFE